jgi:predicted DNA-binding transcriptional regulator YafY
MSHFLRHRRATIDAFEASMFGTKHERQARLTREVELIGRFGPLTAAELARRTGVNRNVVQRDLAVLETLGVRLQEDEYGRIALANP